MLYRYGGRETLSAGQAAEHGGKGAPGTVELSEEAVSEICDHYCKHPLICTSDEELQDICERCPLT